MAAIGALLFLVAVSGAVAFQDSSKFAFPEDVRGPSRIVSGWEAEEGQIPYQMSLRMVSNVGGVTACGATIIHHGWALTAAHCTASRVSIVIRAGVTNLTRPALIFETTEYYNHPLYNEDMPSLVQPNDVGLIKFNRFIKYTDIIQPIRMQNSVDKNKNYAGELVMASGFGRTWTNGESPEIMNWVFLVARSNQQCIDAYGASSIIVESTICAGAYNVSSQSTCQGDSGGPLVITDEDGQLTQIGISSFVSSSGCHTAWPAGFIRPGHYHDWYTEVTGINFDWGTPESEETTEPVPTPEPESESESSESKSSESKSSESESSESKSSESKSSESKSSESKSSESKSSESESSVSKSNETKSSESKSSESKSSESKSSESKSGESDEDEDSEEVRV